MRKKIAILAMLVLFCFVAAGWSFFLADSKAEDANALLSQKNFIRFHVIANSDSPFDQTVKLKVRDRVLDYLSPTLDKLSTVSEAQAVISDHRESIIAIANQVLSENGAGYSANMDIGIYEFPAKSYGALVVPAGQYQAARIQLGDAAGKNWWCVLFPPLCFIDINSSVAAQPVSASVQAPGSEVRPKQVIMKWKLPEFFQKP